MLLVEIPENSNLIFELNLNGQRFEFPSKCIDVSGSCILAEPIKVNGKVLNFKTQESMTVNLIMIREDKSPFVWKGVGVNVVTDKTNKTFYKVAASADGYEMNRRGAFRLFVGITGVAQMGINKKALDVIVKDVSESGFSYVSNEDIENVLNMPVRLVFGDLNMNFSLMGIVVRKVVIDEKKIVYGCQLSTNNANLVKYISEKQRQMLSMNKNNSAYQSKQMLEAALKEPSGITETEDDADYKNKSIRGDANRKRDLNTVGRTERRDIFKDKYVGKKI